MGNETYSGTTGSGGRAGIWIPIVTIDGIDQSARIVGDIRIDAEESAARVADLTVRPLPGATITVADWVGKPVDIDIADMSTGSPANVRRLFTGLIDTPTIDLDLRTISLRCTDNLQNVIDALSNAEIDALTPSGRHSPVVFDPAARGWGRLQDRLSTLPYACDRDPSGTTRLTAWAPATTPDISFTTSHILDGSVAVSLSGRHQLTNHVTITFGYRFPRVKAEQYPITYTYVTRDSLQAHLAGSNYLLRRDAVTTAIEKAGGTIETISFVPLPTETLYDALYGFWLPNPAVDILLCMGFEAEVSFDYAQQIQEAHTLTVSAPQSVAVVGTLSATLQGSLEGAYPPIPTVEHAMLLYKNKISGIPPLDKATPAPASTVAADVSLTSETNRAAANYAMETLIDVAKVRIWGSHRQNRVQASVALNPDIDLDKTISVSTGVVSARGKCASLSHKLSPQDGTATTDFQIAVCTVAGTGVVHPESPTVAPAGTVPATTPLTTQGTADFNYGFAEDHLITVTFPGVETLERAKSTHTLAASYDATLTEDPLAIVL